MRRSFTIESLSVEGKAILLSSRRHCEEQSNEAIQSVIFFLDCFADKSARNDGIVSVVSLLIKFPTLFVALRGRHSLVAAGAFAAALKVFKASPFRFDSPHPLSVTLRVPPLPQ